jgi:hypothetical protein
MSHLRGARHRLKLGFGSHRFAIAPKVISGYSSGNCEGVPVPAARKKPLSTYRRRLKRQGFVRLEVRVRKEDAALVRGVVKALDDAGRAAEARALLRDHFGAGKAKGLKALLAAAPLEGIDLSRERDFGRDVHL